MVFTYFSQIFSFVVLIFYLNYIVNTESRRLIESALRKNYGMSFIELVFISIIKYSILPLLSFLLAFFIFNIIDLSYLVDNSYLDFSSSIIWLSLMITLPIIYQLIIFRKDEAKIFFSEFRNGISSYEFKKLLIPIQFGLLLFSLISILTTWEYMDHVILNKESYSTKHEIISKHEGKVETESIKTNKPNELYYSRIGILRFDLEPIRFADDFYQEQVRSDISFLLIFKSLQVLSILLIVISVWILTSMLVDSKSTELFIRYSYGAGRSNITLMIIRAELISILLAVLLAWVLAFFPLQKWSTYFRLSPGLNVYNFIYSSLILLISILLSTFLNARNRK